MNTITEQPITTFEIPPAQEPHERETFHITDERSADWVLRKLADERARRERVNAWAAAELEQSQNEERRLLERFGPELEAWAREATADGKRKSVKLPNGTVGFRAQQDKLEVQDESAVLEWAYCHLPKARLDILTLDISDLSSGQLLQLTELMHELRLDDKDALTTRLSKVALNDHFKSTGEVPPGCVHVPATDKFYVK